MVQHELDIGSAADELDHLTQIIADVTNQAAVPLRSAPLRGTFSAMARLPGHSQSIRTCEWPIVRSHDLGRVRKPLIPPSTARSVPVVEPAAGLARY